MSEQIDQFFRPDGTLISIPVKPPSPSLPSTTMTPQLFGEIEYGILERDGESVYWVKD
jgi:hypothetical protein